MVYRVIGIAGNPAPQRLEIAFVQVEINGQNRAYEVKQTAIYPYSAEWTEKLKNAHTLSAAGYLELHTAYGVFIANCVKQFIEAKSLEFQIQLVANAGHRVFENEMQTLGNSSVVAALTGITAVSDFATLNAVLQTGDTSEAAEEVKKIMPGIEAEPFAPSVIAAVLAVLRWREEHTITGALWMGKEW
jgi:anhydro-N-acetylmuramic acid kinase